MKKVVFSSMLFVSYSMISYNIISYATSPTENGILLSRSLTPDISAPSGNALSEDASAPQKAISGSYSADFHSDRKRYMHTGIFSDWRSEYADMRKKQWNDPNIQAAPILKTSDDDDNFLEDEKQNKKSKEGKSHHHHRQSKEEKSHHHRHHHHHRHSDEGGASDKNRHSKESPISSTADMSVSEMPLTRSAATLRKGKEKTAGTDFADKHSATPKTSSYHPYISQTEQVSTHPEKEITDDHISDVISCQESAEAKSLDQKRKKHSSKKSKKQRTSTHGKEFSHNLSVSNDNNNDNPFQTEHLAFSSKPQQSSLTPKTASPTAFERKASPMPPPPIAQAMPVGALTIAQPAFTLKTASTTAFERKTSPMLLPPITQTTSVGSLTIAQPAFTLQTASTTAKSNKNVSIGVGNATATFMSLPPAPPPPPPTASKQKKEFAPLPPPPSSSWLSSTPHAQLSSIADLKTVSLTAQSFEALTPPLITKPHVSSTSLLKPEAKKPILLLNAGLPVSSIPLNEGTDGDAKTSSPIDNWGDECFRDISLEPLAGDTRWLSESMNISYMREISPPTSPDTSSFFESKDSSEEEKDLLHSADEKNRKKSSKNKEASSNSASSSSSSSSVASIATSDGGDPTLVFSQPPSEPIRSHASSSSAASSAVSTSPVEAFSVPSSRLSRRSVLEESSFGGMFARMNLLQSETPAISPLKLEGQSLFDLDFRTLPRIERSEELNPTLQATYNAKLTQYTGESSRVNHCKNLSNLFIELCCLNAYEVKLDNNIFKSIVEISSVPVGQKLLKKLMNKGIHFKIKMTSSNSIELCPAGGEDEHFLINMGYNTISLQTLIYDMSVQGSDMPRSGSFLFSMLLRALHHSEMIEQRKASYFYNMNSAQKLAKPLFISKDERQRDIMKLFGCYTVPDTQTLKGPCVLQASGRAVNAEIWSDFDIWMRFGIMLDEDNFIKFDELNESIYLRQKHGVVLLPAASNTNYGTLDSWRPIPLNFNLIAFLYSFGLKKTTKHLEPLE